MKLRNLRNRLVRTAILALALAVPVAGSTWAAGPTLQGVLNLNKAEVEQLTLLPGVGESRARAIVALRTKLGSFKRVEQIIEVKGIGEAALAKMRPYLKVAGPTNLRVD